MGRWRYLAPVVAAALALGWSVYASAQEQHAVSAGEPGHADALTSEVLACATLRNDSERLACYDRLATRLSSGTHAGGTPSRASPQELFGLGGRAPAGESPKAPIERKSLDSIAAKVTSLRSSPQGGVVLELDNEQTWQQQGSEDLLLRTGDAVKISRAALGSFWMTAPSGRGARVKRIR